MTRWSRTQTSRAGAAAALLALGALLSVLPGCQAGASGRTSSAGASTFTRPGNDMLARLRIENQRKIQGYASISQGMSEIDVRRLMGDRPVSPAPNTLEYTAYVHGDADVILIYTLEFDRGYLRSKQFRQIPPPVAPPRNENYQVP